jgi:spore germination protein KA
MWFPMLRRPIKDKANTTNNSHKSNMYDKKLNKKLQHNIKVFKDIFYQDETMVIRPLENQIDNSVRCCLVFLNGIVNDEIVNETIIEPIVKNQFLNYQNNTIDTLRSQVILSNNIEKVSDIEQLVEAILNGDTVLLLEGSDEALIISSKGWQTRSVDQPPSEIILRGPREGFTESLVTNLTQIRRRLKTPDLKFTFRTLGARTRTKAAICYLDGLVNEKILQELLKRLNDINIDGILDTGYIQELIKDAPHSPFQTIGSTERPDIVAANLLEGRIALVLDGTPFALTLPFVFIEHFQVNEDYYNNFFYSSINRLIRLLGFIITISAPAVYVALSTYHQELIPSPLLLSISAARYGVPFPTIVETLLLLFVFEVLREAGLRIIPNIGQTTSTVGALVLGQAAVEASIVSAPIIIIVAITGITDLLIPNLKGASIIIRSVLLLLSAFLGLYGYIFGILLWLIHLFGMRSFGIPYMLNFNSFNPQDLKDTFIRAPWWYMQYRPKFIGSNNYNRKANSKGIGGK